MVAGRDRHRMARSTAPFAGRGRGGHDRAGSRYAPHDVGRAARSLVALDTRRFVLMESDARTVRRVVVASFIGTTIEWYDFFLYGTAAALVFNRLFFPTVDPLIGTLSSFGTFAVGFIARPLGGIVFGHFGD